MSRRPTFPWCRHAAAIVLLLPLAAPAATVACADSPPAVFELSIDSGVMRDGKESRIEVRAHADGCVAVHRPWFLRGAGDYELRLGAQEWAALQSAVAPHELGKVDQQRLGAQTEGVWKEAPTAAVVFADTDGDVFTLRWRDGDASHRLVARNPQQASARQPKSAELSRVATAIGALRALATRAGKRVGTEGAP
ncbi:hypothetical protein DFR29_109129 [Tahibacter aquaticus]|uniref:Uncharacterized protein n=1 Tax=Tahibacter aquaticus TaxID=520092 RepID=A0A4R6YUD4_9GAMM|nr:hypothetical protein [Tahibacter aquaticus]TDR42073.1 hypothetical protein DFR29_109129 [Tahibacter aquaticus]